MSIVAWWFHQRGDFALPAALYLGLACAISGVSARLARETKGSELADMK